MFMGLANVDKDYVKKLVDDIRSAIDEIVSFCSKPFEELSVADRYAIRYCLIVVVEALIALALHIARRAFGEKPETPIHALRVLRDRGLVTPSECSDLEKLVRLRNLLVHRYWVIDDRKIYDSVRRDFRSVQRFIDRLQRALGDG